MFTDYHTLIAGGIIRVIVGWIVLFGVLPRIVLPPVMSDDPWRRNLASFLLGGAFVVVLVHFLALGSMYDSVVFFTVCLGIWALRTWRLYARGSRRAFAQLVAGFLRLFEKHSWSDRVAAGKKGLNDFIARASTPDVLTVILLAGVIAASGLIRLMPVWNHAAPFSVEYYETLQHAKELQLNKLFDEGFTVPLGLPVIAQALSMVSQVNVAVVLHFLGAVSSMMLVASVAFVVYRSTRSLHGAVLGAALFGIFNALLPMDPRHQVEADNIILASAFALPAFSFLVEFYARPSRESLIVVLAGIITTLAVSPFLGMVAVLGALVITVVTLVFGFRLSWLRGWRLVVAGAATILFLGGFLLFFVVAVENDVVRFTLDVLLYDKHVNRYFSMYDGLPQVLTLGSAALFGLLMFLSMGRYSEKSIALHLMTWGALGLTTLFLITRISGGTLPFLQIGQMAFVLSLLLAVAGGSLLGICMRAGNGLFARFGARDSVTRSVNAVLLVAVLAFSWFVSPVRSIELEYTAEPDGFATSMYLIEQRYTPYQWTVVSHLGTALVGMNRGRFLDYDFFCQQYDPVTYAHGTKGAVPTPVLFFFVERFHEKTEIATELTTTNRNAAEAMKQWLEEYGNHHRNLRVFYSDEKVVVYQLEDPSINALRG